MHDFLDALAKRGALLDPAAATYLAQLRDPVSHFDALEPVLPRGGLVITLLEIQEAERIAVEAARAARRPRLNAAPALALASPQALARDLSPASDFADDLRVVRDITGNSTCQGSVEDFTKVFRSRLHALSRILRQRREFLNAVTLEKGKTLVREFATTVIVSDVRTTRNGYRMLTVEDETGRAEVLIPKDTPAIKQDFLLDEVVGLVLEDKGKGYLLVKAVVRPEVPNGRAARTIPEDFLVGFLSDVHVGSKTFLDERWTKFLAWTNGGGGLAKAMKYLIVSGDVVDGIGVYPRQDQELAVDDIYRQYEELARRIAGVPDHVRVVMLPGNHDAVRPAEPQPTFPLAVRKLFDSHVTFVGNPCTFTLHGLRVLAYHGRSMDDWVSGLPGMSYHRPLDVMKEMLSRRHLAPMYGGKTPIAPEAEDYLVIDEVPDIFVTGHVHAVGMETYRGVQLVNASTWQAQTAFQKMHNIEPSPACLPLLNVHTGQATIQRF